LAAWTSSPAPPIFPFPPFVLPTVLPPSFPPHILPLPSPQSTTRSLFFVFRGGFPMHSFLFSRLSTLSSPCGAFEKRAPLLLLSFPRGLFRGFFFLGDISTRGEPRRTFPSRGSRQAVIPLFPSGNHRAFCVWLRHSAEERRILDVCRPVKQAWPQ